MKKNTIFLSVILFILICCNKSEEKDTNEIVNIDSQGTKNEETIPQNNNDQNSNRIVPEYFPQCMLLSYNVYKEANINSEKMPRFFIGALIQIVGYGDKATIDEKPTHWVEIRDGDNPWTGWCFANDVKELKQPIEYIPMNRQDIDFILLPNNDGTINRFTIDGEFGNYSFDYGINKVYVSFYNRNVEFDDEFQYFHRYRPENYRRIELCIENDIDRIIGFHFDSASRIKSKNGIIFIDAFMFSEFEIQDIQIWRCIYFSTNNYDINIVLRIPDDDEGSELIKNITSEAPQYFSQNNGEVHWNDIIGFGNDILNQSHPSKILRNWYNETELIINKLYIE